MLKQQVATKDKPADSGSAAKLLSLAGTWSKEDEAAFLAATADFSRIDDI